LIYVNTIPEYRWKEIRNSTDVIHRINHTYLKDAGHACAITSQTGRAFKVKNSWGTNFADKGYFLLSKKS